MTTTTNQQGSTDKLALIRDVFESTISRFQKAYTPNEHITNDEQLVVFRGKCPFCVFIKSNRKYGIKLCILMMHRIFMPATCKYTMARVVQ